MLRDRASLFKTQFLVERHAVLGGDEPQRAVAGKPERRIHEFASEPASARGLFHDDHVDGCGIAVVRRHECGADDAVSLI
jgi:hypothetical protein